MIFVSGNTGTDRHTGAVNRKIVHDFVGTGSFLGINMLRWKHGIDAEILEAAAYEARRQQLERRLQL